MTIAIEGYASLFGVADSAGDIVRPGAFIDRSAGAPPLPLLLEHDPASPIGFWRDWRSDALGLFVRGVIEPDRPGAARAAARLAAGRLTGLSIGYVARRIRRRGDAGRDLLAVDLFEISLVAFPMLRQARARIVIPSARAA